jgi:hypothetical protein
MKLPLFDRRLSELSVWMLQSKPKRGIRRKGPTHRIFSHGPWPVSTLIRLPNLKLRGNICL